MSKGVASTQALDRLRHLQKKCQLRFWLVALSAFGQSRHDSLESFVVDYMKNDLVMVPSSKRKASIIDIQQIVKEFERKCE